MFTVSARQRNSYLRDPLSQFLAVFSPTSDNIVRPSFINVSTTNNNHDFNSSSRFSPEVVRDLPWVPKRDFPCAVSGFCEDVSARNISAATDRLTGENNFGTQGIKDLTTSSKANLHSSGLQEGS